MGKDLYFIPEARKNENVSFTCLRAHRTSSLFDEISHVENAVGVEVDPGGVECFLAPIFDSHRNFLGSGWGSLEFSNYNDNRLKYLFAHHLKKLFGDVELDNFNNRAIASYINELPNDTRIFLFWT